MVIKANSAICIILIVVFCVLLSDLAKPQSRPAQPIFDGNDGLQPPLRLGSCHAFDRLEEPGDEPAFRSRKVTEIHEEWWAKPKLASETQKGRQIIITRWCFESPDDTTVYPYWTTFVTGTVRFPGWDSRPCLGDRSAWLASTVLVFAKGTTLVKVSVNSKRLDREYALMVAKKIEQTLR